MQTQVRTTFRNWFSLPTLCELKIELSSSGWLQESSHDEPSHLSKSHFLFPKQKTNTSTQNYNVESSK